MNLNFCPNREGHQTRRDSSLAITRLELQCPCHKRPLTLPAILGTSIGAQAFSQSPLHPFERISCRTHCSLGTLLCPLHQETPRI